jgi:L-threonylcarbamoyladenylate synthase
MPFIMKTEIIHIKNDTSNAIELSLKALINDEVICFPTETVYGIGCSMYSNIGVEKVFSLKKRSYAKPLSAHIGSIDDVQKIAVNIPDSFYLLSDNFLPGPLAIILEKAPHISDILTSGMNTIGIRYPDHVFLQKLINKLGHPIAGTSANLSGDISKINGKDAFNYFNKSIPIVLDDDTTKYGLESTVISLVGANPKIFREGVIKKTQLEELLSVKLS